MMKFKAVVLCLKLLTCLIVQRSFDNVLYDCVQKYNTLKMDTLRKYKKVKIKIRKAELNLTLLTNCQTVNAYPKFLTSNLSNVTSHDGKFIKKRLLRSSLKKRKKEVQSLRKDAGFYEKDLAKVL